MIDSNETLVYEYGRDAGYNEGYEQGCKDSIKIKIKTIKPLPDEALVLSVDFDEIDLETAQRIHNWVQDKFPNNTVVTIPNKESLESWDKETLVNFINMVREIIKEL